MKRSTIAALATLLFVLSSLASPAFSDELMVISVFPTDLADDPIASIEVGDPYKLRVVAQDIREPGVVPPGVFGAGVEIGFDAALSSIDVGQLVVFDDFFRLIQDSALSPGSVLGYGLARDAPNMSDPQFVFSVELMATNPGTQVFIPEVSPVNDHENLLILKDEALTPDEVLFVGSSLAIVPEPSTVVLGAGALFGFIVLVGRRRRD